MADICWALLIMFADAMLLLEDEDDLLERDEFDETVESVSESDDESF